jgi:hypothetical protein
VLERINKSTPNTDAWHDCARSHGHHELQCRRFANCRISLEHMSVDILNKISSQISPSHWIRYFWVIWAYHFAIKQNPSPNSFHASLSQFSQKLSRFLSSPSLCGCIKGRSVACPLVFPSLWILVSSSHSGAATLFLWVSFLPSPPHSLQLLSSLCFSVISGRRSSTVELSESFISL